MRRRLREFAEVWPEAVDNLASAVRAGMSLPDALSALGTRGPEPLREAFTGFALDFVKRHKDEKFFLYLPYCVPHAKYQFPQDKHGYESKPWKDNAKSHAAMVTRLDRDVGRLLDLLDDLKLSENTHWRQRNLHNGHDTYCTLSM